MPFIMHWCPLKAQCYCYRPCALYTFHIQKKYISEIEENENTKKIERKKGREAKKKHKLWKR